MLQWADLPEELQIQILTCLNQDSLMQFSMTSRANLLLCQDEQLCEALCTRHFPITAARLRDDLLTDPQESPAQISWFKELMATTAMRHRIMHRNAPAYFELSTGVEIPGMYAQGLGATPRGRHHARYGFGRVALFFHGMNLFVIVNLSTKACVEIRSPSPYSIRDVFLEEEHVHVLTTRSSSQFIFRYNLNGKLTNTLETRRSDLVVILANRKHTLAYSADSQLWYKYDHSETLAPEIHRQHVIPATATTSSTTHAIDRNFFYQLHGTKGILMIYDLDLGYCVSKISIFASQQHLRSELISVNRHCYLCGPGQISFINGLEMTKVSSPGIPHEDDTPSMRCHERCDQHD